MYIDCRPDHERYHPYIVLVFMGAVIGVVLGLVTHNDGRRDASQIARPVAEDDGFPAHVSGMIEGVPFQIVGLREEMIGNEPSVIFKLAYFDADGLGSYRTVAIPKWLTVQSADAVPEGTLKYSSPDWETGDRLVYYNPR